MMKFVNIMLLAALISCNPVMKYYQAEDYERVKKADVHVHIHTNREIFVQQAKEDNFQLVTIALDPQNSWDIVLQQDSYCRHQAIKFPETVVNVTSFSMEGWDEPGWTERTIAWLNKAIDDGAIGVKIWKNIGMVTRDSSDEFVMIDHPRFDPIFKMLIARGIPVVGHLGEPKNCWLPLNRMTTNNDSSYFAQHPEYHMYLHPELPTYEDQIAARDRFLNRNPDLTFIGAHLGSLEWSVDSLARYLDRFPKSAVDLAARMGQLFYQTHADNEKVRNFFIKYQDRLLYATDLDDDGSVDAEVFKKSMHDIWYRDWLYFVTRDAMISDLVDVTFKGIGLPKEVVDKIYFLNAKRWFGVFN
ncbi:MAG: amidohydrolase family protein [Saprospiraceae bacterium]|nr:amidohydrolase family protein [Saprospiraceae bacterium]